MTATAHTAEEVRDLVGGAWLKTETLPDNLVEPTTGATRQPQATSDPDAVNRAIGDAWKLHVHNTDGIAPREQRITALHAAADLLAERAEQIAIADTLDTGLPITLTRLIAGSLPDTIRSASTHLDALEDLDLSAGERTVTLHRLPLGPAAVLAPWNAPTMVAAKKTAFALAAGAPVIIKPSQWTPHGTGILLQALSLALREGGVDPAAAQLVHGAEATGRQLASHEWIRSIALTGSRRGGAAVLAEAGPKAFQLELGSNNPAIVLSDADVDVTAGTLAAGMTKLNGAWCESPGNVYVPRALMHSLVASLQEHLARCVIRDPMDPSSTYGPQCNPIQYQTVCNKTRELTAHATDVMAVGSVPPQGLWIPPTLVIDADPALARDELFGPVLLLFPYDDLDDAMHACHRLRTGLAAYVFTRDLDRGQQIGRFLPGGEVKVNGTSLLDLSPRSAQAFWYGSGVGGHGDRELLQFFTGERIVGQDVASPI